MGNTYIRSLITRFFGKDLPKDVQLRFRQWFVQDEYRREKEEAMREIWESDTSVADESTRGELHKLHKRIDRRKSAAYTLYSRLMRAAAIILLPLTGAVITYFVMQHYPQTVEPELVECFVPHGDKRQLTLPDGSDVWVNAGSILIYSKQFTGKTRTLFLNGEAYFKVAKDPKKPFIVKTKYIDVQALGTRFDVQSYPESEQTVATLVGGKIKVDSKTSDESFTLVPNEQVIYDNQSGRLSKQAVDARLFARWKEGYLMFQGASFNYIVKTIERRFNVTINYEDNKYAGRSFNVKFKPDESLTQVLEVLKEMIVGLRYKIKDNVVYIN